MPDALLRVAANADRNAPTKLAASGVIVIDTRGAVLSFNAASQHLFGYDADEILARNVRTLIAHDASGSDLEFYLRTGCGNRRELIGLRKDGSCFPMEMAVGAACIEDETTLVVIVDDLTEKNRAKAGRKRLTEQLIACNERLNDFARAAAHDLQAPSRLVSAFCGLLLEHHGESLDAQGREYLQLAERASEGMHELVNDLLDYARSEPLAPRRARWFESEACFAAAIANLREPLLARGAVVDVEPMPRVFANPIRFTRVVQNLLENAIKYTPIGVTPRVHIVAASDEDCWRFSVIDNGVGIYPCDHDRVFEPFKRLRPREDCQGTGLGLTICKRIIEGFGGHIVVVSDGSEGSTFTFSISRRADQSSGQDAPQRPA